MKAPATNRPRSLSYLPSAARAKARGARPRKRIVDRAALPEALGIEQLSASGAE